MTGKRFGCYFTFSLRIIIFTIKCSVLIQEIVRHDVIKMYWSPEEIYCICASGSSLEADILIRQCPVFRITLGIGTTLISCQTSLRLLTFCWVIYTEWSCYQQHIYFYFLPSISNTSLRRQIKDIFLFFLLPQIIF